MSKVGQWLREARQAKEFSLEQVEAQTRIRIKFLTALEEGDYEELPGEVYTRGFLRNYALFLDLDPTEALEKYDNRDASGKGNKPGLFRPLEVALSHTTVEQLRGRLVLLVLIAGLLMVVLWAWRTGRLAWPPPLALFQRTATATAAITPLATPTHTLARSSRPSASPTTQPTATHVPSLTPRPTSTNSALIEIEPTSTPSPTSVVSPVEPPTATSATATVEPTKESTSEPPTTTPSSTPLPGFSITLSVTISETNWMEVTVDSINAHRGLMEPGERGTWQARREIILRLGNAGGAEVTLNGEYLGTLGERQQVVEFAWGPEGQVTPAPTATATPESTIEILAIPP